MDLRKNFSGSVSETWSTPVLGSPFYVWEEKLRRVKRALKLWAKSVAFPNQRRSKAPLTLEAHELSMEAAQISKEDLEKEVTLHQELHVACRHEEDFWRQKSRCLWL